MEACASCMERASVVVVPVRCVSNASGRAAKPRSRAKSACCYTHWVSVLNHCSGGIGTAESTDGPACSCCITNGLTYTWSPTARPGKPRLPRCFLVRSGPIIGSRGKSDWHAMPVPQRLLGARSRCSGCQKVLQLCSALDSLTRDLSLLGTFSILPPSSEHTLPF